MIPNRITLEKFGFAGKPLQFAELTSCALALLAFTPQTVHAHKDTTDAILAERSANCADYADTYSAEVSDVQAGKDYSAALRIAVNGNTCEITSNAVPNHNFNATGKFVTPVVEQDQRYTIPANPEVADAPPP